MKTSAALGSCPHCPNALEPLRTANGVYHLPSVPFGLCGNDRAKMLTLGSNEEAGLGEGPSFLFSSHSAHPTSSASNAAILPIRWSLRDSLSGGALTSQVLRLPLLFAPAFERKVVPVTG
ncbi:hypothetical protein LEMLEM_LOCUS8260 [Lemmus lemmus]